MVIERGKERGSINQCDMLKVFSPKDQESPWIRVIAIHKNRKQGIGLMQNTLFNKRLRWGELVLFREANPKEIPRIIRRMIKVPDSQNWTTDF